MLRLVKFFPTLLVLLLLGFQVQVGPGFAAPPVPRFLAPQWAQVPQVQGVYYAPNLEADLFRYGDRFYYLQEGIWQIAAALTGPWQVIQSPPPVFYNIGPNYFKNPPGWARGKKTGWRGAPMPPGQMKKMDGGGHVPPGQMKKHY